MRLLIKSIVLLLILVVVIPVAILFMPASIWQSLVTKGIEMHSTGKVVWGQPLEYTPGLKPSWTVKEFSLSRGDGSGSELTLPRVSLSLDLTTLPKKVLTINEFSSDDAVIKLIIPPKEERRSRKNETESTKPRLFIQLNKINLTNTQFTYNELAPAYIDKVFIQSVDNSENQVQLGIRYLKYAVDVKGFVPNSHAILSGDTNPFELLFKGNAIAGDLTGKIGIKEVDSIVNLNIENLESFSPLAKRKLPDIKDISISSNVVGPYSALALPNIDIQGNDPAFEFSAKGQVDNLVKLSGINIIADIQNVALKPLLALYGFKWSNDTTVKGTLEAQGSSKKLALQLKEVNVDGGGVTLQVDGKSDDVIAGTGGVFDVKARIDELSDVINTFVSKKWQAFGSVDAQAKITAANGLWNAAISTAQLKGTGRNLNASGIIADLKALKGVDIAVEASIDSLKSLNAIPRLKLMDFGPISATANLVTGDNGDFLKLKDIKATHNTEHSRADLVGIIGNLTRFDKVDLSMSAWVSGLDQIKAFTVVELPALGSLRTDARLTRNNNPISIDVSNTKLEGPGVNATGNGRVYDTGKNRRWVYEADVEATADSLKRINVFIDPKKEIDLPPIGPLYATTHVVGDTKKALEITGDGHWGEKPDKRVNISYKLEDVVSENRLISGKLNGTVPNLHQIFSTTIVENRIKVGTIRVDSTYRFQNNVLSLTDTSVAASGGDITASIQGTFADVTHFSGLDGSILLEMDKPILNEWLAMRGLEDVVRGGGLTLKGQLVSERKDQKFNNFQLKLGEDEIHGSIRVVNGKRPKIFGDITLDNFRVKDRRKAGEEDAPLKTTDGGVIPDTIIPLEPFRLVDADLNLKFVTAYGKVLDLSNTEFAVSGKAGNWQLEGQTLVDHGIVQIGFDASTDIPRFTSRINSIGLKAGALITQPGVNREDQQIPLHIDWDLVANGRSLRELASDLTGYAHVFGKDIYIGTQIINIIAGDLTTELLGLLNNSEEAKVRKGTVQCIGLTSTIDSGMIHFDKNLGMKTDALIISGDGTIDLETERLRIGLAPVPRRGFGVGTSSIVRYIGIGGTFASPRLDQTAGDVVKNGILGTLALATGGTSAVVLGLLGRVTSDESICEHAYSGELKRRIEKAGNAPATNK